MPPALALARPIVRWPMSGAPLGLGSQSLLVVAALRSAGGLLPEAGQWAVEGRATGAGAGAGAAVQRTRKDRVIGSCSWTSLTTTARTRCPGAACACDL